MYCFHRLQKESSKDYLLQVCPISFDSVLQNNFAAFDTISINRRQRTFFALHGRKKTLNFLSLAINSSPSGPEVHHSARRNAFECHNSSSSLSSRFLSELLSLDSCKKVLKLCKKRLNHIWVWNQFDCGDQQEMVYKTGSTWTWPSGIPLPDELMK